ncbi:unnamed protein product [Effrenium voratum]|uniref:Peptidase C1A papain C-terminal domain-containing protein n=1 Tax=Effrenium voratum TaxID=2562239 RepID=A0AA36ITQ9_9DINO|nr:unnamed protein product [Effrenium voratum]
MAMSSCLAALLVLPAAADQGFRSSRPWLPRAAPVDLITADMLLSVEELPREFDWRDVNGRNFVTSDVNQHIPQYCGSCWIHGTTASLNDRIKVMRNARFPDVMLARQVLMNCVPSPNKSLPPPGCDGGDPWMIHQYLMKNEVPDESCMPYQARNMECVPKNQCRNCLPGMGCWTIKNWTGYGVSSFGNLSGEVNMMKEIYARGPITCSFATDGPFMMNYSQNVLENDGVYISHKNYTADDVDHNMEIAGWGVSSKGIKYWVVRNSWGTYWGSNGWLKLQRGVNMLLSEADCDWSVPRFEQLDEVLKGRVLGSYMAGMTTKVQPGLHLDLAAPAAFATAPTELTAGKALGGKPQETTPAAAVLVGAASVLLLMAGLVVRAGLGRSPIKSEPLLG